MRSGKSGVCPDGLKTGKTGGLSRGFMICVAALAAAFVLAALVAVKCAFADVGVAERHFRPSAAR